MKMMFETFVNTTEHLVDTLKDKNNQSIEVKDLFERYTADIIASCAFGIDINCIKNPDNELFISGKDIIQSMNFRVIVMYLVPHKILHFFNVRLLPKRVEDMFTNIIRKAVEYREANKIERNDIMQSLLKLKNGVTVKDDEDSEQSKTESAQRLTFEQLAAECSVFFAAGYETSSATLGMACLELALNPDIQNRLRAEIISYLEQTDGKMTYDTISEMKYLDQVVNGKLFLINILFSHLVLRFKRLQQQDDISSTQDV